MADASGSSAGTRAPHDGPFERVYRGILKALYEGAIVPGQRLATPDMMRQFDVGRGTVREVLHRLASSGVVSMVPHRGAQLRLLARAEIENLLDIVELLLGLAARGAATAAAHGGAGELAALTAELARPVSVERLADFYRARDAYYQHVVQLAGNAELQRIFPAAQVQIMRTQLRRFGNAADAILPDSYAALTAGILSGDPARAEAAGRDHVRLTRGQVLALPDAAFAARAW